MIHIYTKYTYIYIYIGSGHYVVVADRRRCHIVRIYVPSVQGGGGCGMCLSSNWCGMCVIIAITRVGGRRIKNGKKT